MKRIFLLFSIITVYLNTNTFAQSSAPHLFGEMFTPEQMIQFRDISSLMQHNDKVEGISIEGYVLEVCQKMGCWIRIIESLDSDEDIFVKMKDHDFFVPKDIAGQRVIVHGDLEKKEQSIPEQKHYLEDANAPKEEIDAIIAPKHIYQLNAAGVLLFDE
jgi:hypothetical protein